MEKESRTRRGQKMGKHERAKEYLSWKDNELTLDREETSMSHRNMEFIKVQGETTC